MLFQARTSRIGLGYFLASVRVLGAVAGCSCIEGLETAEHVLLHCPETRGEWSRGASFQEIVSTPASAKRAAKRLIQCGKLGQLSLANVLLYQGEEQAGQEVEQEGL